MTYEIHHGDCIEVMRTLPSESVDAIVTSPPYAEQRKSTYGGIPEAEYPDWTVAWMAEAWRALKPNGSALINIRPHVRGGQISDYTLRTRLALRDAGWSEIEEIIWHKQGGAPLGHTGRPRRSWESIHWFGKHGGVYCNPKAAGKAKDRAITFGYGRPGPHIHSAGFTYLPAGTVSRVSDVVEMKPRPERINHPAPFPWQLAEWCGKLVCPPGGTILDPFSGSASTGVAAIRNGWHYIGIDTVEEYVEMSRERLDKEAA